MDADGQTSPVNDGRDPATGRFVAGNRANPDGRPARQRETRDLRRAILDAAEDAGIEIDPNSTDGLRTYLRQMAQSNVKSFAPLLGRVITIQPVKVAIPVIEKPADLVAATSAVATAVAEGELSPGDASAVSNVLSTVARAVELHDLQQRIAALEATTSKIEA